MDLLYRFTEPDEGTIYIDNEDIKDYEISYLRSCLGAIRDEPPIFKATLR
jgi:ABC-type multidrug transport system fused ATPase/permease subunit